MNPTDETPETPEDDGLGDLADQALQFEAAGQTQAAQRAEDAAADTIAATSAELVEALKLVRAMAAPTMAWWPQFGDVWSDAALQGIANAAAQVMQRHGWTMSEAWAKLGPYIALIGSLVPPSLVTWSAIKQRQAMIAAAQRRPPQAPPSVVPAAEGGTP